MGIISVALPSDGSTADVSDYNTPITSIVNLVNGNLDSTNISSLSGADLIAGTVPGSALDSTLSGGYLTGLAAPNTVTYNGNRSYDLTFNSVNYSTTLSPGMRARTTRTVAAPTQCASLNGSTNYFSKTSPAGMTFTDDFTASAWVKLTSYASCGIISRYNGTSGWILSLTASGQIELIGLNGGAANQRKLTTYQSLPLNRWVHVTASLDMSGFTTTTCKAMIDGVDVPVSLTSGGTNPTSLVQAGNLEVGTFNAGAFFPGKIAQAAVFSSLVSQSTMRGYMSQSLAGTETSLISAYSFNNSITDLNTTNANNLTNNGSTSITNADSPFGGQADGTISSTLDYCIIQKVTYSTNTVVTVQVPEGCTISTSGGVSAFVYSTQKAPFGMPVQRGKWRINTPNRTNAVVTSNAAYGSFLSGGHKLTVPVGEWRVGHTAGYNNATTTSVYFAVSPTDLTGMSTTAGYNATSLIVRTLASAAAAYIERGHVEDDFSVTAQTAFTMYTVGATTGAGFDATVEKAEIFADNAFL